MPNGASNGTFKSTTNDTSNGNSQPDVSNQKKARPRVPLQPRGAPKSVKPKKIGMWDVRSQPKQIPEEVKKNWIRSAKRGRQLKDNNLLYTYDRIKPTEMRLLFISPAKKRDMDLFVSLETYPDNEVGSELEAYSDNEVGSGLDRQPYEALSYHWGPSPATKPVYIAASDALPKISISDLAVLKYWVPDFSKGKRFYVRDNLDKALRHLRHPTSTVVLWVDAICINQSDTEVEKPAQIAKMKTIYNKANNVCIWLGDGKGDNDDRTQDFYKALKFSQEIIELNDLEALIHDTSKIALWSHLLDLMRCSWFSRRWVIQELALAREATVHCGEKYVHWQEFADAIGLFNLNFDRIRALFRSSTEHRVAENYKHFNELEPLGAKVLVDAITNTFRRSLDNTIFEPVYDLETLVTSLAAFESSDPRDTIFALLNIARESVSPSPRNDEEVGPPRPDYLKDILEVYTDFLEWVICSSGSLDILCRQWAIPERVKPGGRKNPTPLITLPSWIQTIDKSAYGFQEQGFNGRINGDTIVGKAGRKRYNASYWKKPEVRFGRRRRLAPSGNSVRRVNTAPSRFEPFTTRAPNVPISTSGPSHQLFVKGLELGSVVWKSGRISRGVIPSECLEKGGLKTDGDDRTKVPDKLWRTLVADRTADGDNPPPYYHRAALHCMALADNLGHIGTIELLDYGNSPDSTSRNIVVEYLKRVQAITWNRQFLQVDTGDSAQEYLFGLGPPDVLSADRICILFGCSVPCVLRPMELGDGTIYYKFIGEAYIYGRMDGEAILKLGEEAVKTKTKEFVII